MAQSVVNMNALIEEIFLKCLGSAEKLKQYISQDIDLINYIKTKYGVLIGLAAGFLANRKDLLNELKSITHGDILEFLKRRRPDLYQILQTEEGKNWFKKQKFENFFKF